jgi:PmbA protein
VSDRPASPLVQALRTTLAGNKKIHAWQFRNVSRKGYQTYLVKTQLESERRTQAETIEAIVFVKNGDLLGRSAVTLGPGDLARVGKRIDEAVFMAGLGGDAPWDLPASGEWPKVESYDPTLAGDQARETSRTIVETWRAAAAKQSGVRPSSMELFCGEDWITLENSAGLSAHDRATRVSMLTMLLGDGTRPSERYSWDERRRVSDLDVAAIVQRTADEARDLTQSVVPPTGEYPVVIDSDEITALLDPIQVNASAAGLYEKSSRYEIGKPLPIEKKEGEPLTVISNAIAPYGLTSYAFDGSGTPGQRVELVKDGVFAQPWATKQYADYLKTKPTGGFANWEIPAGKTSLADLTSGARVLYVRAFSWLTPDQARGNFGSEIRVGYLYENGARKPIKGGTVSGNVYAALGAARFCKETVFRGDYLGPAAIRFERLSVTGA